MKIGLVGFPGSGKTTVFNALTGQTAETGHGGARGKTHLGTVRVPDARVDALSRHFQPKKTTYAEIVFTDVAAQPGAAGGGGGGGGHGKGLDAQTLQAMRDVDALCHVVRGFTDEMGEAPRMLDEVKDLEVEMNLADLILVEKRIERLHREKTKTAELALMQRLKAELDAERPLRELHVTEAEEQLMSGFRFLSQKPLLLVLNVEEAGIAQPPPADVAAHAKQHGLGLVQLSGKVEMDIAQMPPEDQVEFAKSLGLDEPALGRFIRAAYALLDLISFLTAGADECRAWTIRRATTAHKAAGKIHSDIERGFIRAEVMRWEDLVALGSEAKCREQGKLRLEGKDYVVHDGDVINFRFAV